MAHKALCVHAHFYQPSREDPFTGQIPEECGAEPFANWNERITANCYQPNAQIGNFEKISFNLGPTLTQWMQQSAASTLTQIQSSEQRYLDKFKAANALAQPYHHTILPLASRDEKEVQVEWGISAYRHVFRHNPEGMWLPETAVDLETLEVLYAAGIQYTILAPWQAAEEVDTTRPYRVNLPNGSEIVVFFYDRGLSTNISFNPMATINADTFVSNYVAPGFRDDDEDQLLLIATDGELYGHHQIFRDKFLNYLLNGALHKANLEFTTPGVWLKQHWPTESVHIRENTSWSCDHGILRWSGECACTPHCSWKQPMREFMNTTAGVIDQIFFELSPEWLTDSEKARKEYVQVLLGEIDYRTWQDKQTRYRLSLEESEALHHLFEAQFERQRMFTSCGWFFEDFDRIEPRNNIRFAAHALCLSQQVTGRELVSQVRPLLRHVYSRRSSITAEDELDYAMRRFQENSLVEVD